MVRQGKICKEEKWYVYWGQSMPPFKRWLKAQQYEKSFWQNLARKIENGITNQLDWYAWKAGEMEKRLAPYLDEERKKKIKVIEIGSGPIGIVSFLKWGERYTIDPLEDFYRSNSILSQLRDPCVCYGKGNGEQLPFRNGYFSLAILDNVLDHVHNASEVLQEIHRVLYESDLLYLAVNVHTEWGAVLHTILSKLNIDKGHPYTFTIYSIRDFIHKHQFTILSESINDYYKAREQNLRSSLFKDKVKGYTGLSEFIYFAVCSKNC